jgi:putative endonuclease
MQYFVYILWSTELQKFYIGQTQDLENRLKEHNAGEGSFSAKVNRGFWFINMSAYREKKQFYLKKRSRAAEREGIWLTLISPLAWDSAFGARVVALRCHLPYK